MPLVNKVVDGEIVEVEEPDVIVDVTDDELTDIDNANADIDENDESKDPNSNEKVVEPWMEDEDAQTPSDVPVGTHIRMKQKLKGRLTDKNEELETLKAENIALKAGMQTTPSTPPQLKELPKKPQEEDYDTIQEHEEALNEYDQKMVDIRLDTANKKVEIRRIHEAAKVKLEEAVDGHYSRAAKLIQDNGIDTEVYKKADQVVREAIETILPNKGDLVADQIISIVGEGSEKVMYFLGRNKNALNEFKSLLMGDSSGLKAAMFLGQQKERLLQTKRKTSNAPPPDGDINGDKSASDSSKGKALLRKREAAIKKGNIQLAYDIKKQARGAGVDVSNW